MRKRRWRRGGSRPTSAFQGARARLPKGRKSLAGCGSRAYSRRLSKWRYRPKMIPPGYRRVGLWPAFFYYRNRNGGWALSQALQKASTGLAASSAMSSVESSAKTSAKTSEGKAAEVDGLIAHSIDALGHDIVQVQLRSATPTTELPS